MLLTSNVLHNCGDSCQDTAGSSDALSLSHVRIYRAGDESAQAQADRGITGHLGDRLRDEIQHLFDQLKVCFWSSFAQMAIYAVTVLSVNPCTMIME